MMNLLFPLVSILGEAAGKTVDKLNLSNNHISATYLMRLVFIGMSSVLFMYIVVAQKPLPHFSLIAVASVALIIAISFAANVLDYLSLKVDDLSLREPLMGIEPVIAGLVGYIIFPEERKTGFLFAFAVSVIIVYFGTHRRKNLRKFQKKGMIYLTFAVALYATLPSVYKLALPYIGPEYIAFFRSAGIVLLMFAFLPIKKRKVSGKGHTYGLISGAIYALATVANLYAIQKLGVVATMLLMMLAPTLHYLVSYLILKEKVRGGEVISSAALLIVVVATIGM